MDKGEDPTLDDPTPDENTTAASGDVVKFNAATFTVLDAMNFYVQWLRDNEKSAATITHVEAHKKLSQVGLENAALGVEENRVPQATQRYPQKDSPENASAEKLASEKGDRVGNSAANSAMTYLQIAFNKAQYEHDDNGFPPDALNPIRKGFPWFPGSIERERLQPVMRVSPTRPTTFPRGGMRQSGR